MTVGSNLAGRCSFFSSQHSLQFVQSLSDELDLAGTLRVFFRILLCFVGFIKVLCRMYFGNVGSSHEKVKLPYSMKSSVHLSAIKCVEEDLCRIQSEKLCVYLYSFYLKN